MSIEIPKSSVQRPVDTRPDGERDLPPVTTPVLQGSSQTRIPIADAGAANQTSPTNALAGRLGLDVAGDVRARTKARIQHLHDRFEAFGATGATKELATNLRTLDLESGATYGRLSGVLSTLTGIHHYQLDSGKADIPSDLRAAYETSYLAIFEDYLGATGDMLTKLIAATKAEPSLRTMTSLEERGRYGASAARGSGKSENEHYARLSDQFAKTEPEAAKNLPAARSALKKLSIEARELHADLAGFDKGSLSLAGRTRLLYIDAPNADRGLLDQRLDAVEAALDRGANRLASSIFSFVGDVLPSIGIMEVLGPLTEEKYEKRLTANHAPISLADVRAVNARMDELRPRVIESNLTNRLDELEALQAKGFETPRNMQYGAEGIVKRAVENPIEPALLVRAQKMFLRSILDQIEQPHAKLRALAPTILAATALDDTTSEAAHSALRFGGPVDQPESMDFLDDGEQSALNAARTAYADLRSEVQAKIQGLVDKAFEPLAAEHAEILRGPEDQQQAAMGALYDRAGQIDDLLMYLPDTKTMSALCRDIHDRVRT